MLVQKLPSLIIMSFVFAVAIIAKADTTPPSVYSFKTWKEQQVLLAQNRLLRTTAELEVLKNSGASKEPIEEEKSSSKQQALKRFHRAQEKSDLERLENEVRLAKEAVQTAAELTLDDYVTIYLPTLTQSPKALDSLVESMSREEIASLLKEILKNQSDQRDRAAAGSAKLSGFLAGQTSPGR